MASAVCGGGQTGRQRGGGDARGGLEGRRGRSALRGSIGLARLQEARRQRGGVLRGEKGGLCARVGQTRRGGQGRGHQLRGWVEDAGP